MELVRIPQRGVVPWLLWTTCDAACPPSATCSLRVLCSLVQ